jgi:hypothetical protein
MSRTVGAVSDLWVLQVDVEDGHRSRASSARVSSTRVSSARVSSARVSSARVSSARVSSARVSSARVSSARASSARAPAAGLGVLVNDDDRVIVAIFWSHTCKDAK